VASSLVSHFQGWQGVTLTRETLTRAVSTARSPATGSKEGGVEPPLRTPGVWFSLTAKHRRLAWEDKLTETAEQPQVSLIAQVEFNSFVFKPTSSQPPPFSGWIRLTPLVSTSGFEKGLHSNLQSDHFNALHDT